MFLTKLDIDSKTSEENFKTSQHSLYCSTKQKTMAPTNYLKPFWIVKINFSMVKDDVHRIYLLVTSQHVYLTGQNKIQVKFLT